MVAAGVCVEVTVQVAYALGIARPMSLYITAYGSANVTVSE